MSVEERVDAVVVKWCGQAGPYPSSRNLKQLWESTLSKHDYDFQPEGVKKLIVELINEFNTGDPRLDIELVPTNFEPKGTVKTIYNLAKWVAASFPKNASGSK